MQAAKKKYLGLRANSILCFNVRKHSLAFRHFSQLNIMFVGGPNVRKDYHIEEGEEVRVVPIITTLLS